jgi:hypothetical protein
MDRTSFVARNQSEIPLPAPMPMVKHVHMPSVAGIGGLGATATTTPTALVQRLPSIVNPTPVDLSTTCDWFTLWVANNPGIAMVGLATVAYFTIFHKGGKK